MARYYAVDEDESRLFPRDYGTVTASERIPDAKLTGGVYGISEKARE